MLYKDTAIETYIYSMVYSTSMTQKNGKESIRDFLMRAENDAITKISDYNKYITQSLQGAGGNGLSIADMGSKISLEEGKLEILRVLDYLTDDSRD